MKATAKRSSHVANELPQRQCSTLVCFALAAMTGCSVSPIAHDDASRDAGPDAPLEATDDVDILIVVDDSGPTAEEQAQLPLSAARMLEALITGDVDRDGAPDVLSVGSLHVGVVTSDMGVGSATVVECDNVGDDGVLVDTGAWDGACRSDSSPIFEFRAGVDDAETFVNDALCATQIGTDGCAYQEQIEAPLRALAPAPVGGASSVAWTREGYAPPVFRGDAHGHGGPGGANDGFVRADSVLAVVLVTIRDDCSAANPEFLDQDDPRYRDAPNGLRCQMFADRLYPVERYVDGLSGLRRRAGRLVYGVIAGIPP